jgi:hypothetical protein
MDEEINATCELESSPPSLTFRLAVHGLLVRPLPLSHMRFRQEQRNNVVINILLGYTRAADPARHRSKSLAQTVNFFRHQIALSPKGYERLDQHQPRKEKRGWPETPNQKCPCRDLLWHTASLSSPCQNRSPKVGPTPDPKLFFCALSSSLPLPENSSSFLTTQGFLNPTHIRSAFPFTIVLPFPFENLHFGFFERIAGDTLPLNNLII